MINLLVTGGCGFIGSNFINYIHKKKKYNIINLDALYYCANKNNINKEIRDSENYNFINGNLCDSTLLSNLLKEYNINVVIHFAAQSHVTNSFENSLQFTNDNILGTHTLLECCRKYGKIEKFIHVSTDEVYGESMLDVNEKHKTENSILCPTNPYAATKAGAELIAQSYHHSFKLPIIITRGNNVYGPNQYPEKLIPKFIKLLKDNKKLTIEGDGSSVRAFLHVNDTSKAFECILENGKIGEIYNIGCDENMEYSVIEVAKILVKLIKGDNNYEKYLEFKEDRPFNDKRYYISNKKLKDLNWNNSINFMDGIKNLLIEDKDIKINIDTLSNFQNNNCKDYFGEWINNEEKLKNIKNEFNKALPFKYVVIDNFLDKSVSEKVFQNFPEIDENWHSYYNPIEVKFANDDINKLNSSIKNIFYALSTHQITKVFSDLTNIKELEYDPCLHGAGLHAHSRNGRLGMHLDYEKHPILNKTRQLNIILYLSKDWDKSWNGATEFWDKEMKECITKIDIKFNRAVIFQTNEISWHGLPELIKCPENVFRKSLAYYYLSPVVTKPSKSKFGGDVIGYRTKAAFIKRPSDPDLEQMKKLYKIRPYRRITKDDMDNIWPEWDPSVF